ncbi:hypothetical protein [Tepidiforma sp.]|uniref:helix-turn-helix transcriptional regulator n=1 Tax=Tepidiforma sp. TaxID=2682230 RepID=UPI002ADE6A44|nr:hypothetical protein [Tepidiforma sp.]
MPPPSCLDRFDPTRRTVLLALRRLAPADVETIAEAAYLSVGAARQYLQGFVAEGLVAHEPERRGPGRPRYRYALTPAGESLFPRAYDDLANSLIAAVLREDDATRERIFSRLADREVERHRPVYEQYASQSPLRGYLAVLEQAGYFPDAETAPEGVVIRLHNCPVLELALEDRTICDLELRTLSRGLPPGCVERLADRPSGSPRCIYRLRIEELDG